MASQRLLERARGGGRVLVVSSMASIMCVPLACMVLAAAGSLLILMKLALTASLVPALCA
jgi:hypothetical protein